MRSKPSQQVTLGERLLLALSRDPNAPDYPITTTEYTLDNALDFARKTIPGFPSRVRNRAVLDYGCGPGWQAVAMHRQCGSRHGVGLDINQEWLAHGRELAERERCDDAVTFTDVVPSDSQGILDVVLSLNSFEHFNDPAKQLARMRGLARPGGFVVISFAEPWYSHSGSHMNFFTKVPWVNILFSEQTVLRVRERFRSDGAMRYEEVEGGLNRVTLRKFEEIIRASGLRVVYLKYHTTRGLPLVDKLPVVREFLVATATCILQN
jgi:SAM-dependent methyltransferase